jgi:uncharacterized protein YecT (DUF1311 family)
MACTHRAGTAGLVAVAMLLTQLAADAARAAPSFDCKAANETEKVICGSDKLSALDREIADAYKAALRRLAADAAAVVALRESQRHFIALRDKGLGMTPEDVDEFMKTHRNFLRSIAPRAGSEFLGLWETVGGVVIIKKGKGGKFDVAAETFGDPMWGNRYCGAGGDFTMRGAALLSANGRREWNQKLTRRGYLLVMEEVEPVREPGEERKRPDTCGANGSLEGTFFPVRGPKPSYGDTIRTDPPK